MKALVVTDIQAGESHERLFSNPSISLQQWRVRMLYEQLLAIYKTEGCDCLWDLGDLTDDRTSIPIPVIDLVLDGLSKFPDSDYNLKLVGNHEQFLRSGDIHVGKLFSHKFKVFSSPGVIETKDFDIVMAPYPGNDKELADWLRTTLRGKRNRILLGHFQVVGCAMSSGRSLTGIPKQVFSGVKLGLLGHVHRPQTVDTNVHYIGSPFQQDFGEANEDKRVAIVDTDDFTVKWVRLDGFPRYRTVSLQTFQEEANSDKEDRYKVVIKNQDEAEKFYANPLSTRAEAIYEYENTEQSTETSSGPVMSLESLVMKYLKMNPPGAKGITLSLDEMSVYGREIAECSKD